MMRLIFFLCGFFFGPMSPCMMQRLGNPSAECYLHVAGGGLECIVLVEVRGLVTAFVYWSYHWRRLGFF